MLLKKLVMVFIGELFFLSIMTVTGLCEFNEDICACFGKSVKENIYISYLSLIDADTKSSTFYSQEAALLNNILNKTLQKIIEDMKFTNIQINAKQYTLKNTYKTKSQLIQILSTPGMFFMEKIQSVRNKLKISTEIDAVCLGEYREFRTYFEIYINWILFHHNTYAVEKLLIDKKDLFGKESNISQQKVFDLLIEKFATTVINLFVKSCPDMTIMLNSPDQLKTLIDQSIIHFMEKLLENKPPSDPIYVSNISFTNTSSSLIHSLYKTEMDVELNKAVENGIAMVQRKFNMIKYNEAGHILVNSKENAQRIFNILFDNSYNKSAQLEKINDELMIPANIDIIVSGLYYEKGQIVEVRPFIIVGKERVLRTKIAKFNKSEFLCTAPVQPTTKFLCQGVHDEISKMVKDLLEQL